MCCMIQSHRPASDYSASRTKQLLKAHTQIDKALKSLHQAEHQIRQYINYNDYEAVRLNLAIDDITKRGNDLWKLLHPDPEAEED